MDNKIKTMAAIGILLMIGAVYWAFQGSDVERENLPEEDGPVAMSYIGNTISEEKDGKKSWEITAEFIEIDPATKNTILKNIKGIFYQENGDNVTITAPTALYDVDTRNITITERVKAVTDQGATLDADKVVWDSQNEVFEGEGDVKVTQEDTVITGDKIESNRGITKIKVSGNAHIIKGGK